MKYQRRNEIIKMLLDDRMLKANELAKVFQVSTETIRRDMEFLEKEGLLSRVHGGAVVKTMHGIEPEYTFRKIKNYEKKIAIGREAAKLVTDGDTIVIDLGTTTLEFAKFLRDKKRITVFTNSIQIAIELANYIEIKVILIGGVVKSGEYSTSGFLAEDMIGRFNVDKSFLGVGAITLEHGLGDYHMEEANLRRHFVSQAQKVIALADYSKFGVKVLNKVCDIKSIDYIVTDIDTDKQMISEMSKQGVKILIAEA